MSLILILIFGVLWLTYKIIQQVVYISNSKLDKVPGPYLCKLTSSISAYRFMSGRMHYWIHELHLKYGPVVQFAPNSVSIITREGIDEIYGTYKFKKTDLYKAFEFGGPNVGTISERTKHSEHKKLVLKVLSSSNLDNLEAIINEVGLKPFIIKLDKIANTFESIDILKLCIDFYFDIVGMTTVGERFDLITNGSHPVTDWIGDAHKFGVIDYHFPWIKYFGDWFGKEGHDNVINFTREKIRERKQNPSTKQHSDFLDIFLNKNSEIVTVPENEIIGEVSMQFVAGIEATGSTLAWLVKLLIEYPECMKKLQQELDEVFPDKHEEITYKKVLSHCPYLEATLNESFRIFPVAGGNSPRIVPEGGFSFSGYQLPAGMEIGVTNYAYARSPDHWSEPDTFNPDRFLNDPNQVNKSNLFPFSKGPHSCVGRELALLSLHLLTATLFRRYNVALGTKGQSFVSELYFTLQPIDPKVMIILSHRN